MRPTYGDQADKSAVRPIIHSNRFTVMIQGLDIVPKPFTLAVFGLIIERPGIGEDTAMKTRVGMVPEVQVLL